MTQKITTTTTTWATDFCTQTQKLIYLLLARCIGIYLFLFFRDSEAPFQPCVHAIICMEADARDTGTEATPIYKWHIKPLTEIALREKTIKHSLPGHQGWLLAVTTTLWRLSKSLDHRGARYHPYNYEFSRTVAHQLFYSKSSCQRGAARSDTIIPQPFMLSTEYVIKRSCLVAKKFPLPRFTCFQCQHVTLASQFPW